MNETAIRRLLAKLVTRYREGVALIPADLYLRWKRTIIAGIGGLIVLIVLLVHVGKAWAADGRLAWEPGFLRALGAHSPFSFSSAVWYQTFGTDITLWILIILTAGIAIWMRRPISAWSIIFAYIAIDPIVRIGWALWDRDRPNILYNGIAAPAFHSFPSGHTAKTVAVYGILTLMWMRASRNSAERVIAVILFLGVALVVPVGRLVMGVHWPSDIIAGWLIGLCWLALLGWALRFERR